MDGDKILKIQDFGQFWPFLVLWGPRGAPWEPPTPRIGNLPYSSQKYLQNETSPRLLAQSVYELLKKQAEPSKKEGPPPFKITKISFAYARPT